MGNINLYVFYQQAFSLKNITLYEILAFAVKIKDRKINNRSISLTVLYLNYCAKLKVK